jgi:hypothetical protein
VLEGVELQGTINTDDAQLLANIRHSIRLKFPQIKPQSIQSDEVLIVGGGPSLNDTEDELVERYFAGAKLITVNGSYQWCLDRNLRPSAQIVLDARAGNARFLHPVVPRCKYMVASQCAPETWAAVAGRPDTWIWHAAGPDSNIANELDQYYQTNWHGIVGGTTVAMRAIELLRTLGFLRMHLFGVDSCYMGNRNHAYAQPENEKDRRVEITAAPVGHPELGRKFQCAPWHLKQLEDLLQIIRVNGEHFVLNIHGDGLLAYALRTGAEVVSVSEPSPSSHSAIDGSTAVTPARERNVCDSVE